MNINDLPAHQVVVASANNRGRKIYHTRNCGRFPDNPKPMDRAMADAWGFEKCAYCSDENPNSKPGRTVDLSYQDALKEAAKDD